MPHINVCYFSETFSVWCERIKFNIKILLHLQTNIFQGYQQILLSTIQTLYKQSNTVQTFRWTDGWTHRYTASENPS
jgi:hypothetical protein